MFGLARLVGCCALAWALQASGCGRGHDPSGGGLLHRLKPLRAENVAHAERLNDGRVPREGEGWLTDLSVVFERGGVIEYDLGAIRTIDALFLSADNNDAFFVAASEDGLSYHRIWSAEPVSRPGMRARSVRGLSARGRFLRVTARGGDRFVGAGELLVWSRAPEPWPPAVARARASAPHAGTERALIAACAALALLLVLADARLSSRWLVPAAACVTAVVAYAGVRLTALWPVPQEVVSTLRAALAALGVAGVLAWTFLRPRRAVALPVLSFAALLAIACFYNFGRPWFWNEAEGRPTPVHTFDMRVYFPVAKYFPELGFDGVYLASVRAYLDGTGLPPERVHRVELRDLRDNRMVRVRDVSAEIAAIDRRFTPERWRDFVEDMRFFWRTMGRQAYLGSLRDHGGNATPAWLAVAHLLFRDVRASEHALTLAAVLDPLLLLLLFVAVARCFDLRAALLCAIVFGTTDFPMFGSNWAGSTLRFDWMAAIGFGACALRRGRVVLGGALLAYAGLVRAFPALALAFAALPAAIALGEALLKRPGAGPAKAHARELFRLAAGAGLAILVLALATTALFGFRESWGAWLHKIELHADKPNTNHVGVRTLLAFDPAYVSTRVLQPELPEPWTRWQETQIATYERRAPLALALRALFCVLCVLACRRARPEHAALVGLLLIPVLFYPANYYLHCVFLLPLLAAGRPERPWIEAVVLAMGVAQLFTLGRPVDVCFFWQSAIALAGFLAVLAPLAAAQVGLGSGGGLLWLRVMASRSSSRSLSAE